MSVAAVGFPQTKADWPNKVLCLLCLCLGASIASLCMTAWLTDEHPLAISKWPHVSVGVLQKYMNSYLHPEKQNWYLEATVGDSFRDKSDGASVQGIREFMYHVGGGVLETVGWPMEIKFAKFIQDRSADSVLQDVDNQIGAFVMVVAGDGSEPVKDLPLKDDEHEYIELHKDSVLCLETEECPLPLKTMNAVLGILSALQPRFSNYRFTINIQHLPWCDVGLGACAIWDVSTLEIVLHTSIIHRSAFTGVEDANDHFSLHFMEGLNKNIVGDLRTNGTEYLHRSKKQNKDKILEMVIQSAIVALQASLSLPMWYCISCPIILGMLLPFAFNFGLTDAADEACSALNLTDEQCQSLWLSSFALATMLSFASVFPILAVCKVKQCFKTRLL